MADRRCCRCNRSIRACMGYVHAGDWLAYMYASRRGDDLPSVREYCGICVHRVDTSMIVAVRDAGARMEKEKPGCR